MVQLTVFFQLQCYSRCLVALCLTGTYQASNLLLCHFTLPEDFKISIEFGSIFNLFVVVIWQVWLLQYFNLNLLITLFLYFQLVLMNTKLFSRKLMKIIISKNPSNSLKVSVQYYCLQMIFYFLPYPLQLSLPMSPNCTVGRNSKFFSSVARVPS